MNRFVQFLQNKNITIKLTFPTQNIEKKRNRIHNMITSSDKNHNLKFVDKKEKERAIHVV